MAEATLTDPRLFETPELLMRGVPESIQTYATPKQSARYLLDPRVQETEGVPVAPQKPEDLTFWRRAGRFLQTPLSLVASQFSPKTAPKAWDIITQKREFSFIDVLKDKGIDERKARWWGLALDIILDPLNFVSFISLNKFGQIARRTTRARDFGSAFKAEKSIAKGIENIGLGKGMDDILKNSDLTAIDKRTQAAVEAIAGNANMEFGTTWYQQAARGQRSLMQLNIPFTGMGGLRIVPNQVSMMAFAMPAAVRDFFLAGAKRIRVPGSANRTLADTMTAMIRKGSGVPVFKDLDYFFQGILKGQVGKVTNQIVQKLKDDVMKIGQDDWELLEAAFESRKGIDLAKTQMDAASLIKAGIPKALANRPEVHRVLLEMKNVMKGTLKFDKILGLRIGALDDNINYLLHYITPEAEAAIRKSQQFAGTPKAFTDNHVSALRRGFRDMTIKEVNDAAKAGTLKGFIGVKFKGKFFDVNPLTLITTRMHRSIRSAVGMQYFRTFGERAFDMGLARLIPKGLKGKKREAALAKLAAEGFGEVSTAEALRGFVFKDASLVAEADRHFAKFTNVESISDFFKYYDATLGFWKGITLAPFPAYHIRNYGDNIFRNYLAGVSPVSYLYARAALGHFDKVPGLRNLKNHLRTTANGERLTFIEMANEAQNTGVIGHNARDAEFLIDAFRQGDLTAITQGRTKGIKGLINPRASENTFIKVGFDAGRKMIEDPARLAHYIDKRLKGDTVADAMFSVKKYLFDYEDLTDFERNVMRRIFPFYSWMRFNIPFQFEQLLSKPGKVGKIAILERSKIIPQILGKDDRRLESKFLGEWQREGAPFFFGRDPNNPDKVRFLMLDGWVSTFDLINLFDPGNYFVNNLNPLFREPFSQIANFDFFFRRPITSMSNFSDSLKEKENFLAMSINRRTVHVLRNIRAFNEMDRIIKNITAKDTKVSQKFFRIFMRQVVGGSFPELSQAKGARDLKFRVQRVMREGRRAYLRALRRNRPDEANDIMQQTWASAMRGGI